MGLGDCKGCLDTSQSRVIEAMLVNQEDIMTLIPVITYQRCHF